MLKQLFFEIGPAIQVIFQYGEKPIRGAFKKIDAKRAGFGLDEQSYEWMLKQPHKEILCVTEKQMESLLEADRKIMSYVPPEMMNADYESILRYVAKQLPHIFSKGTKYDSSI